MWYTHVYSRLGDFCDVAQPHMAQGSEVKKCEHLRDCIPSLTCCALIRDGATQKDPLPHFRSCTAEVEFPGSAADFMEASVRLS